MCGTRTIGTAAVVEIACNIVTAVWKSTGPCCRSMVTLSNPWCAIISAEYELAMASQPLSTVPPPANILRSSFFLMGVSLNSKNSRPSS